MTAAADVLQAAAQAVQQRVHTRVAEVASRCLRAVFGDGAYEFRIEFERKRGRTEARPLFRRNGNDVEPLDGVGGGVLDVTAFALRVVCLVLKRPARRKFLVLDEPLKHLSAKYHDRAAEMIRLLSEEFGIQILLITHNPAFEVGKVIRISGTP